MTMRLLVCTLCVFGPKNFGIGCCDSLLLQSPPFDPMAELTTVIPTLPMPRRLGWTRSAWTVENILTTTPRSLNKLFIFSLLSHHEWNISNRSFQAGSPYTRVQLPSRAKTPFPPLHLWDILGMENCSGYARSPSIIASKTKDLPI